MSVDFWIQLWSGTFGAIVGAVVGAAVAVVVLARTNKHARVLNTESINAAKEEAGRAIELQERHFKLQLEAQRDEQRRALEIQAVAELLEFMSTELQQRRITMECVPKLMVLCNRLTLNSTSDVVEQWNAEVQKRTGLHPRVLRHPLAAALVPWIAAHELARTFPNTAPSHLDYDIDEDDWPTPLLSLISGVDGNFGAMHRAVERVSREMLGWSRMTSEAKAKCFDEILATSAVPCSRVMAGANLLLGATASRMRLVHRIKYRPDLVALNVIVKEVGNSVYHEGFDFVLPRLKDAVDMSTLPPVHPDAWIIFDSTGPSNRPSRVRFELRPIDDLDLIEDGFEADAVI